MPHGDTVLRSDVAAPRVVVCGAGGFIGGHLVRSLRSCGVNVVRTVDIKPIEDWQQATEGVENLTLDLRDKQNGLIAVRGADHLYQLAADMGGMGFIQNNKALSMLNVLTSTNTLLAAQESGVSRFFDASSACVYNAEKQTNPEGDRPQRMRCLSGYAGRRVRMGKAV